VVAVLGWVYMEKRAWNFRQIKLDLAWFLSAPLTFCAYLYYLYRLTGSPLAFLQGEAAWNRTISTSPGSYLSIFSGTFKQVDWVDLAMLALFFLISLLVLIKLPSKSYGIFCLGSLAIPLLSRQLFSMTRFLSCVFPAFILLGAYSKNRFLYYFLVVVWFTLLILFWVGWLNYYWIE